MGWNLNIPPHLFYQIYLSFLEENDCTPPKCGELSDYTDSAHTQVEDPSLGCMNVSNVYDRCGHDTTTDTDKIFQFSAEKKGLELENYRHKHKTDAFYKRIAMDNNKCIAICVDHQKDLYGPNKSTNDVYKKIKCISFNIHVLCSKDAFFYCYDETVAKKGSDDVPSLLYDLFLHKVCNVVTAVDIFCDSGGETEQKYTVIRFLHWLVHDIQQFHRIKVIFPFFFR